MCACNHMPLQAKTDYLLYLLDGIKLYETKSILFGGSFFITIVK